MQTKIRPYRVDFFLKINKRACTSIRYTRVTHTVRVLTDHGEHEGLISGNGMAKTYTTNPGQICLLYSAKKIWSSLIYSFIGFLDTLWETVVMEMGGLLFTGLVTLITLKFFDMGF